VHQELDRNAVLGDGRLVAQLAVELLTGGAETHLLRIGGLDICRRTQMDMAVDTVNDDRIAVLRHGDDTLHLPDGGQADGAGNNDDMAGRRSLLEDEASQAVTWVIEQL